MYETETHFKDPSYEGSPLTNIRDNFASQADIPLKETSRDLQRIGAVVDGLKRVYDNVAQRAAEGMALTPQEASDVNMAVTGMAETASVDCQTLSTENFLDPYGAIVSTGITMEGIKEAIVKGLKRTGEIIMKLISRLVDWFSGKSRALQEAIRGTRHAWRDFGKIVNTQLIGGFLGEGYIKINPEMAEILMVDGGMPQNLAGAMAKFYASCGSAAENTGDAIDRVGDILDAVFTVLNKSGGSGNSAGGSGVVPYSGGGNVSNNGKSKEDIEIEIGVEIAKRVKYKNYQELTATKPVKTEDGTPIRIGPALIGGHVLVFNKPTGEDADELAQDGSVVMTIKQAEDKFGIKTGYATELKGSFNVANFVTLCTNQQVGKSLDINFNKVFDIENKVKKSRDDIIGKLHQINRLLESGADDGTFNGTMPYIRTVSKLLTLQQSNLGSTMTVLTANMNRFTGILDAIRNQFIKARGYQHAR